MAPPLSVLSPSSLQQPQLHGYFLSWMGAACLPGRSCLCLDANHLLGPQWNHKASLHVPTCRCTCLAGHSYVSEWDEESSDSISALLRAQKCRGDSILAPNATLHSSAFLEGEVHTSLAGNSPGKTRLLCRGSGIGCGPSLPCHL